MTMQDNNEITQSQTAELFNNLFIELSKVIVGQQKTLGELIIGFLAGGHLLMEGVPGVAKTLMVRTLASVAKADFKRVQFTPDLMPGDLTGINIFNPAQGKFELRRGPIFTDILLADEINRTPPKTQSALLEAMQERQVTIDGESYLLGDLFTVVATQNPIEYEGTYPLPEAELDRFLMKLIIEYPLPNEERDIILRFHKHGDFFNIEQFNLKAIADEAVVKKAREEIRKIHVEQSIADYIVKIITATRNHPFVALGSSPRAGISFIAIAKTSAAINKRNFVMPDDIKEFARPVLRHRLILKPEAEIEGISPDDIIDEILEQVTVPR